ncbi:fibronectin type III domain-containing protein [Nocardioides pelophilus]|uniref:fibronectin type III domain-containing protein n=1 Tax=Nocardioides pelophilus TaxID=2172019 RepID=UPI00160484BA|nr:fibronectin type III domain-containing protein [Nocardioides pelophilus]
MIRTRFSLRWSRSIPHRLVSLPLAAVTALVVVSLSPAPAHAATVPGPPTNVIGTKASATSAQVSFSPPASDGGAPITSYTAQCTSTNGGNPGTGSGSGSPLTVGSLSAGATYQCRVHATNSVGPGPLSAPSPTFVLTTLPGAPVNVNATKASATSAQVTFNPPASNGGEPITSYMAECTSTNGGNPGTGTGGGSPLIVGLLSSGFTYQCRVRATNSVGSGPFSEPSFSFVLTTTPGTPTDVTASKFSTTSARVAFSPPTSNGGAQITSYTAQCNSTNGGASGAVTGGGSPLTVSGLSSGFTYQCQVRATNSVGDGTFSPPSAPFVLTTVPGPPTSVNATKASPTSAEVTFSPPASDGGAQITSYTAVCNSTNGGASGRTIGSESPLTVGLLSSGSTYRCQVSATNAVGTGPASDLTPPIVLTAVPGMPTNVTAVQSSPTSLQVSFDPPASDGGSTITGYEAECASGNDMPVSVAGASSPIDVDGLTTGATYECQVRAMNDVGFGEWSATSSFTLFGPPGAPTDISATASSPTSAQVSFSPPANTGWTAITDYAVECSSGDGGVTRTASGVSSPITVTGLTPGATYTCQVRAINSVGPGDWSVVSDSFTMPATLPGQPTGVSATAASSTTADVSFSPPAFNGGSAITSYTARCVSTNGGITRSQTGASSPIKVQNLGGGRDYQCQVRATNSVGSGAFSPFTSTFSLPATRPDAPTVVTVTAASSTSATVNFSPPAWNGGSAITSYVARCESTNGGIARTKSGSGSPITVTSLTKGKKYRCQVRAINSVGVSAYSALTSTVTLPPGVPDAPRNVAAIPLSSTSARVSFSPPVWNGGSAITSYLARCVSSNGGITRAKTGTSSPLVVAGLTPGKTYRCQVRATNAVGNSPLSAFSTSFKLPT